MVGGWHPPKMRSTNIYDWFFSLILSGRGFLPMKPLYDLCDMFSELAPQHPTPVKSFFNIILSVRIDQYRSTNFPLTEEQWMIYRWPCFFAVLWFGSSSPLHHISVTSTLETQKTERQLDDGRGWARSRIIQPQESLIVCNSFDNLCVAYWKNRSKLFTSRGVLTR